MLDLTWDCAEVNQTIDTLAGRTFQGFLKEAGDLVIGRIRTRLAAGLDPDGRPLAPNDERQPYGKWKTRYYPGRPPLTVTGQLAASLTEILLTGDQVQINVSGTHNRIPYYPHDWNTDPEDMQALAKLLEEGGTRSSPPVESVVPRPFLGMNTQDMNDIFLMFGKAFEPEFT